MKKAFCPFVQGDCRDDCTFYSGEHRGGYTVNCQILCASQVLLKFSSELLEGDKTISKRLENIESELSYIYSNVSTDQTDSSSISDTLGEIEKLLKGKL